MKKLILVLSSALSLIGCAADDSANKQTEKPRFGEPVSSIPWNQPTDWERAGQLGSVPGMTGGH
jgi:hypothetical protein